jgi:hypothetical protein
MVSEPLFSMMLAEGDAAGVDVDREQEMTRSARINQRTGRPVIAADYSIQAADPRPFPFEVKSIHL